MTFSLFCLETCNNNAEVHLRVPVSCILASTLTFSVCWSLTHSLKAALELLSWVIVTRKVFWVPYSPVENSTAVRTNYLWVFGCRQTHSCGEAYDISICETQNAKPKYFAVSYEAACYSIALPHYHCMLKQYVFNSVVLYEKVINYKSEEHLVSIFAREISLYHYVRFDCCQWYFIINKGERIRYFGLI